LAAGAGAPARVHLYLASSNAALSFFGGADAATLLQTARDQYRKARPQAAELAPDLRFISPRILRVLQGS
jgi:hypothetical protein